jgi:hypothetical protein
LVVLGKIEAMRTIRVPSCYLAARGPAFSVLTALMFLAGSVSLLTVPVIRSAETHESGSSHERCEDPTLAARVQHEREFLEFHRGVAAFLQPVRSSLGHAQRPVLDLLPGHRLANGLLAPMTC